MKDFGVKLNGGFIYLIFYLYLSFFIFVNWNDLDQ